MTDDYQKAIRALPYAVYCRFKEAVELGKWPDGQRLTEAQRESCLTAMLHYEALRLPKGQRTGHIEQRNCDNPTRRTRTPETAIFYSDPPKERVDSTP